MGSGRAGAWLAAVAWALGVAGCSGSSGTPTSASVTGTISGNSLPASDAVGLRSTVSHGTTTEAAVGVIITNVAGACSVLQAHGNPANATALTVVVTASGDHVATGTYMITQGQGFGASASYTVRDGSCNETSQAQAYSGSVTLTAASESAVSGSFDVTFNGSDHVTGSFSAPICTYGAPPDGGTPAACK